MAQSQTGQTQAQRSSQAPRTRAPPEGSTGSGNQRQDSQQPDFEQRRSSSNSQDNGNIASSAVTSSTSRPKRSSYPEQDQRRQSQVTFAKAPPVDPSDSISQIKARSTWPGPNRNSNRRSSRNTRTSWNEYASQVTRSSSQHGDAWSGSGPALTENNLEKLNEETDKSRSQSGSNTRGPQSDQQEVPQSNRSKSRRQESVTNGGGAQTNGTTRRSSRQYSQARDVYSQAQSQRYSKTQNQESSGNSRSGGSRANGAEAAAAGVAVEGAGEAAYSSQSRRQSVAVSKNVVDANNTQSGANQPSEASQSKSKAMSESRSRRDSKLEEVDGEAAKTSNEVTTQSKSQVSRSKAPSRPSQPSTSPTSPNSPTLPWGYERRTKIITKRWPDGTEVREREVRTMQPVGAA